MSLLGKILKILRRQHSADATLNSGGIRADHSHAALAWIETSRALKAGAGAACPNGPPSDIQKRRENIPLSGYLGRADDDLGMIVDVNVQSNAQ
jgi:hypothetical protein